MTKTLTLVVLLLCHLSLHAVQVTLNVQPARCGLSNGRITSNVFGGIPPYIYAWSNGASTSTIQNLAPGSYTLTVTDGLGGTVQATATVQAVWGLGAPSQQAMQAACAGACSGHMLIYEAGLAGTPPYTYSYWSVVSEAPGVMRFTSLCPGSPTTHTVTDANGCPGSFSTLPTEFPSLRFPVLVGSSPSCGASGGSLLLDQPQGLNNFWVTNQEGTYDQVHLFWELPGPHAITGLPPGNYTIQIWDPMSQQIGYCTGALFDVIIEALPEPCGALSGRVFHDADQDCAYNGADIGLPYCVLAIEPGAQLAITDGAGDYQRALEPGSYTLAQPVVNAVQLCPAASPVPFTIPAGGSATVNLADSSTVPHDIRVIVFPYVAARPGFPTSVRVSVRNLSYYPSGALSISLNYDPLLQLPGNATWSHPGLPPFGCIRFTFDALVPPDVGLLGQDLVYTATATNTAFEQNTLNNTATAVRTITGSYDPNDKQGVASYSRSTDQFFLDADEWIDYTVRFQNTGTDTAFTVVVRDTLAPELDILSLEVLDASHAFTPSFGNGRALTFTFNDILLPDSATDLLGSQGFVAFRLKPIPGLLPGDAIANTAGIYFDFNDPIITNTTVHAVEVSTGVGEDTSTGVQVFPNPATDAVQVLFAAGAVRTATVLGADGRVVTIPARTHARGLELDVAGLAPGLYVVRTPDGTARFVKR